MTGPTDESRHHKPEEPNPAPSNGELPLLPKWFATKGPRPYWLAENWSLIVALLSALVVLLNTVITVDGMSVTTEKWVNAAVAWIAAGALFLQSRQKKVTRIAEWRKQVRDEEESKGEGE
jgi:hypothetical protein